MDFVLQVTNQPLANRLWRYAQTPDSTCFYPKGFSEEVRPVRSSMHAAATYTADMHAAATAIGCRRACASGRGAQGRATATCCVPFAQAVEVGPFTARSRNGPCLVHFKRSSLSPAQVTAWLLGNASANSAVVRVYWLGASYSEASSRQDLLRQLLSAWPAPQGGRVRLQCAPRDLETWLGDELPASFNLQPVDPDWVLNIVRLPAEGSESQQQQQQQQQQQRQAESEQDERFVFSLQPAADLYNYPPVREKRVPDQLSKAAGKLAEALQAAGLELTRGVALDLGAAPGGVGPGGPCASSALSLWGMLRGLLLHLLMPRLSLLPCTGRASALGCAATPPPPPRCRRVDACAGAARAARDCRGPCPPGRARAGAGSGDPPGLQGGRRGRTDTGDGGGRGAGSAGVRWGLPRRGLALCWQGSSCRGPLGATPRRYSLLGAGRGPGGGRLPAPINVAPWP
jgi:hypothetical protein